MKTKIALVTGASSGIGKATAEALAAKGHHVYAAARSVDKLEAMRTDRIEPLPLDVTDPTSITSAVETIMGASGRIDVLVNNAGYRLYGTIENLTPEAVQRAFDVNVFGLGGLTQAVLPIMRGQGSGTIVNVSSLVGKVSTPVLGWYGASKHAVEGMSDALRLEVKPFGIDVVLVEPGSFRTTFQDVAMSPLVQTGDLTAYDRLVQRYRERARARYERAPGPEAVANTIADAVDSPRPRPRYIVGRDAKVLIRVKGLVGDRIFDRLIDRYYR